MGWVLDGVLSSVLGTCHVRLLDLLVDALQTRLQGAVADVVDHSSSASSTAEDVAVALAYGRRRTAQRGRVSSVLGAQDYR